MAKGKEIWVCPQCNARIDIAPLGLYAEVRCPRCLYTDRVHAQLGNFRLDGVLGVGGMSVVYRAFDVVLHRALALKVLNDTFRDQPERIERFENESAMMARVRHENVTSVYSAGRAYGQFYIAMELVEGSNLEHMVTKEEPLAPAHALGIIHQVAKGLEAAQKAGLLHRDMKPGNVLITPDEQVKVIDFGLALDSKEGETEEIIWATPYYVPPETLQREPEDVRTDIYALGMTLRYLLTGIESFGGPADSVTALLERKRRLKSFVKKYPHMLRALGELVDHMTAFAPADRPASYQELIEEITEVQQALAKHGAEQKKSVSKTAKMACALAASVALGGFLAYTVFPSKQNEQQELLPVAEWSVAPSAEQQELSHALELLSAGEVDAAAEALLRLAQNAPEACIGAWSAQLAATIAKHVILKDSQAEAKARELLALRLKDAEQTSPAGKQVYAVLAEAQKLADPPLHDWKQRTGEWAALTAGELAQQKSALRARSLPAPLGMMWWYDLAEKSLWIGDEDSVQECLSHLQELGTRLSEYAGMNRLYAGAERRLAARRLAVQEQQWFHAKELAKGLKLDEAADVLRPLVSHTHASPGLRRLCSLMFEACVVGKEMDAYVRRKLPSLYKEGMGLDELVALAKASSGSGVLWALSVKADSEQAANTAAMAVDGSLQTRWCAGDANPGHTLTIQVDAKHQVGALEIHWENDLSNNIELVVTTSQGEQIRKVFAKREASSHIDIGGKKVSQISITVTGTGYWKRWASVREVELYGMDGRKLGGDSQVVLTKDFMMELDIVAHLLSGRVNDAVKLMNAYLTSATKENQDFAVLAHDWRTHWVEAIDVWKAARIHSRNSAPPGKEALEQALSAMKNIVRVKVLPGKSLAFLNQTEVRTGGKKAFLMDEEARLMQQEGVVEILATSRGDLSGDDRYRIVTVMGLKDDKRGDQYVRKGDLRPCSYEDAKYFAERESAVIVDSVDDLKKHESIMHEESVNAMIKREPVL